jgi:hypothetical protein
MELDMLDKLDMELDMLDKLDMERGKSFFL